MKPKIEVRPWGQFEEFTEEEKVTVKILSVLHGEKFSLQFHHYREEFWKVLKGHPKITIGDAKTRAEPGAEFDVPPHVAHRIHAINDDVEILEISSGKFDENDIVRLEDKYNRS